MAISITPTDVRGAGDFDQSEHPDSSLQFEISLAENIVNDDLAPHSESTGRLEQTAALLAAALVEDGKTVTQLTQGNRSLSFSSEESKSLFDLAKMADPTGQLGRSLVGTDSNRHVTST